MGADGINIHGSHMNVTVDGCSISHSGDDGFAMWSEESFATDIKFTNNFAAMPRYPRTWLASCYAQYGGNHSIFGNNTYIGTGNRGMIYFAAAFHGKWAPGATATIVNNTQDSKVKPVCGG